MSIFGIDFRQSRRIVRDVIQRLPLVGAEGIRDRRIPTPEWVALLSFLSASAGFVFLVLCFALTALLAFLYWGAGITFDFGLSLVRAGLVAAVVSTALSIVACVVARLVRSCPREIANLAVLMSVNNTFLAIIGGLLISGLYQGPCSA